MIRRSVPATWMATGRGRTIPKLFPTATRTKVGPFTAKRSTDIPRGTAIRRPIRSCSARVTSVGTRMDGTSIQASTTLWEPVEAVAPGGNLPVTVLLVPHIRLNFANVGHHLFTSWALRPSPPDRQFRCNFSAASSVLSRLHLRERPRCSFLAACSRQPYR